MMMILVGLSSDYNFSFNWSFRFTELQSYTVSELQSYKVTRLQSNSEIQNLQSCIPNP